MIFWDFDHTLFQTHPFTKALFSDIAPLTPLSAKELFARAREAHTRYDFQEIIRNLDLPPATEAQIQKRYKRSLGAADAFLFSHTDALLGSLHRHSQHLVTKGIVRQQKEKVHATSVVQHLESLNFVQPQENKASIIKQIAKGQPAVFIDDNPQELLDVSASVPNCTLIRMMWPQTQRPPHPQDGTTWHVATNFDEVRSLLQKK